MNDSHLKTESPQLPICIIRADSWTLRKGIQVPLVVIALLLFASAPLQAEEKPRQSMSFQPGAKAPEGSPAAKPPAVPAATPDDPARIATAFFDLLGKNRVEEAYTSLTKGSKIAEKPEELRTLKAKTTEAIQLFGEIHGSEMVGEKTVGVSLLRRTYISLGRDLPLRWRFYFYRSEKQWRLVDLRVDDRLTGLFDETDEPATTPSSAARDSIP